MKPGPQPRPCASILKRRRELGLGDEGGDWEEGEIEESKRVRFALGRLERAEDLPFHGSDSVEAYLKLLREQGLDPGNKVYAALIGKIAAARPEDPLFERGISKVGRILEEKGHSGSRALRAACLLHADKSHQAGLGAEIGRALEAFLAVRNFAGLEDFAFRKGETWYFRPGALFPDFYALRILAFSDSWKSEAALEGLKTALRSLAFFGTLPSVYLLERGRKIAPAAYSMRDFNLSFGAADDDRKAEWLQRNECLARMGILGALEGLTRELGALTEAAETPPIKKRYSFLSWGSYTGLALEEDWRSPARMANDLRFRFDLIRRFAALERSRPA